MKHPVVGGKIKGPASSGGILLEAVFTMLPLFFIFLLFMEIIRREVFSIAMIHTACFEARAKTLGEEQDKIQRDVKAFFQKLLGERLGTAVYLKSQQEYFYVNDRVILSRLKLDYKKGGISERFYRYPQWVSFTMKKESKHHQEVRQRCLFPF